jgi:hypothetical protein
MYINVSEQHTDSIFRVPFVITDSCTIQGGAKVTWHHLLSLNREYEITFSLPCTNKTAYYIPCRYVHKLCPPWLDNPTAPRPPHWAHLWARRKDLYLTTHNTHKIQASMPPAGIKPAIPASDRQQNQALDRAATGIGPYAIIILKFTGLQVIFIQNCVNRIGPGWRHVTTCLI